MTGERLPSELEVSGLLRRVQANGDFATVLRKGDADRGSIILVISSRGRHVGCLERSLGETGEYRWKLAGPGESESSAAVAEFVARSARFDGDCWAIELDIAAPERFIAETTSSG